MREALADALGLRTPEVHQDAVPLPASLAIVVGRSAHLRRALAVERVVDPRGADCPAPRRTPRSDRAYEPANGSRASCRRFFAHSDATTRSTGPTSTRQAAPPRGRDLADREDRPRPGARPPQTRSPRGGDPRRGEHARGGGSPGQRVSWTSISPAVTIGGVANDFPEFPVGARRCKALAYVTVLQLMGICCCLSSNPAFGQFGGSRWSKPSPRPSLATTSTYCYSPNMALRKGTLFPELYLVESNHYNDWLYQNPKIELNKRSDKNLWNVIEIIF